MARAVWLLFLLSALARAQEEPCGEGCGEGCGEPGKEGCGEDEAGILIDSGAGEGTIDMEVDPFDQPPVAEEPNRPEPVEVGAWQPPDLDEAARREMDDLLRRRGETPDDAPVRYRLAEFYLAKGWLPQAEAEFLSCVRLDPDSIRPWEGLLRVYAVRAQQRDFVNVVFIGPGFREVPQGGNDWLQPKERTARITKAWQEIVRRRPDDVAKRREFLNHLKSVRDVAAIEAEAREILARLPGDADTRFDLAEAVRRRGAIEEPGRTGAALEALAAAQRILEENLRASPGHAPSALRLARILAKLEGTKAEPRIAELEERAFFALFVRPELLPVEFRQDTLRMAKSLAGPSIARVLWDSALAPPRPDWRAFDGSQWPSHVQRWIYLAFPNAQPKDQTAVLERLARRGDRDAAGILLAFLWHLEGPDVYDETALDQRTAIVALEAAAVDATARLGAAAYPGAERFLKAAQDPRHRRRAASLVRRLKDPRAVASLCEALAWETEEAFSYGIPAALEELLDAKAVPALADAALDARRPAARRREAAEALAAFQDARAIEAMSRLAKEPGLDLVAAYGLFRLAGDEAALSSLRDALRGGSEPAEVLRLLRKCDGPRVEALLVAGLDEAPPPAHPLILALLRERYAESSREQVRAYVLKQAQSPACPEELIEMLGDLGGEDAAGRLLAILETADGTRWAKAARALAKTGDPRGVRYFSKTRIVDGDPSRRRLADELYETATARRAEVERAAKKRSG